jgi:hypothetical protein
MQYRQPMQRWKSIIVIPSALLKVAWVGQTRVQGAFLQ